MNITYQFIISALLGGIGELGYLITSYALDDYTDKRVSNLIGLSVDTVLDFILQSWLFLNPKSIKAFFDPEIIIKFIISILIMNLLRQLIFMVVYEFKAVKNYVESDKDTREKPTDTLAQKIWKFFNDRTVRVRYIITLLFFILIEFPVRKYLVFIKK